MAKPRMVLLDEPSMGLAPLIVEEVFEIVKDLNTEGRVSLCSQNRTHGAALRRLLATSWKTAASSWKVRPRIWPATRTSRSSTGLSGEGRKSFRDVKHYRRRKRWLS